MFPSLSDNGARVPAHTVLEIDKLTMNSVGLIVVCIQLYPTHVPSKYKLEASTHALGARAKGKNKKKKKIKGDAKAKLFYFVLDPKIASLQKMMSNPCQRKSIIAPQIKALAIMKELVRVCKEKQRLIKKDSKEKVIKKSAR